MKDGHQKKYQVTLRIMKAFIKILFSIKLETSRGMINILNSDHLENFGHVTINISIKPTVLKEKEAIKRSHSLASSSLTELE